jgi:tRNA (cytidine/uridine-2'-O-)-methyltransferase
MTKNLHTRRVDLPFTWPEPGFDIALIEPEIPQNTGNIGRLCLATGTRLHLVGPLGFRLSESALRRAGLDYWKDVEVIQHLNFAAFEQSVPLARCHFFSTGGIRRYDQIHYRPGDILVFGSESRGLDDAILTRYAPQVAGIPMKPGPVRSLNLATSAGIVLYEALRQGDQGNRQSGDSG